MASFTFATVTPRFPIGTVVGAYLPNTLPGSTVQHDGAAITTATVASNGSLVFSGLNPDTAYVAYAQVSGVDKYRRFRTAKAGIGDNTQGMPGLLVPSGRGWTPSAQAVTADITRFSKFQMGRDMLVTSLSFALTVQATNNDPVQVGIYNRAGTTLLASSTSQAVGVNSLTQPLKTVSLQTPLQLRYGDEGYAALSYDYSSGTGATILVASWGGGGGARLAGLTAGLIAGDSMSAQGTLPSALTFAATGTSFGAMLFMNEV